MPKKVEKDEDKNVDNKKTKRNVKNTEKDSEKNTVKNTEKNYETSNNKSKEKQTNSNKKHENPDNPEIKKAKKDSKKENTEIAKKSEKEIQEAVGKEIKENKKMPQEELKIIYKQVFQNVCIAIAIMIYLNFLILGFVNIKNEIFITDLKVFGITLLAIAIGIFEYAYNKDSGKIALYGIETLLLSFVTIALIYINLIWNSKFVYITAFSTYVFAIYYIAKSIVIYNKMKKQYFFEEMKKIIKK